MKQIAASVTKGLQVGSKLRCADNSGVKELEIISVFGFKGRRRMRPEAGVADLVSCKVAVGVENVRHQVWRAVVIRQRKEFRRPNGLRVSFDDNAGVIVNEKNEPKGTIIKGPVAKEAVQRFPLVAKIATVVV
ncbi:MAG TPA: 50S ribosomal protein L14 [archaeon]|nr:50S ribosomal protein L14 [archaeon]